MTKKQNSSCATPSRPRGSKNSSSSSSSSEKATRKGRKILQNGMTVEENQRFQSLQKQCESLTRKANQRRVQVIRNDRDRKNYEQNMFLNSVVFEMQMFSGVKDACARVEDAADKIDIISQEIINNDVVGKLGNAAEAISNLPKKVLDVLKDKTSDFVTEIMLTLSRLAVAPKLSMVAIEIISVVAKFTGCIKNAYAFFMDHVKILFEWGLTYLRTLKQDRKQRKSEFEMQMFDEVSFEDWPRLLPFGAGLAALLGSALLGIKVTNNSDASKQFQYWAQYGSNLSKYRSGIKTVVDFVKFVMEETRAYVIKKFPTLGIKSSTVVHFQMKYGFNLIEYVKEVIAMTDPLKKEEILADPNTRLKLEDLLNKTTTIAMDIMEGRISPSVQVSVQLRDVRTRLMEFAKTFDTLDSTSASRFTPFVVCLAGDPGCGKSVACDLLAKTVTDPRWCSVPLNHQNLIYSRNSMDKYWSLYNGQSVTILDDFGQKRGSAPSESEYAEFINLVSAVPWSVPMAAVEDKGKRFKGKLILMTTNDPYPVPQEIMCKEAVWRRRNILVECVKKESAQGVPNPITDCTYNILDPMNSQKGTNVLSAKDKRNGSGQKLLIGLTYKELCSYIVPRFNQFWENYIKAEEMKEIPEVDLEMFELQSEWIPMHGFVEDEVPDIDILEVLDWNEPRVNQDPMFVPPWLDWHVPERPSLFEEYHQMNGEFERSGEGGINPHHGYHDFPHEKETEFTCCAEGMFDVNVYEFQGFRYCGHFKRFFDKNWKVIPLVSEVKFDDLTFQEKCCTYEYYKRGFYTIEIGCADDYPGYEIWMSQQGIEFHPFLQAGKIREAWRMKYYPLEQELEFEQQMLGMAFWKKGEETVELNQQFDFEGEIDVDRFSDACESETNEILEAIENGSDYEINFTVLSSDQVKKEESKKKMRQRIVRAFKVIGMIMLVFGIAATAYAIKTMIKPKEVEMMPGVGVMKNFVNAFPSSLQTVAAHATIDLAQQAAVSTMNQVFFGEAAGKGSGDHRTMYPKKQIKVHRMRAEFGDEVAKNWVPMMEAEGTRDKNAIDFARNRLPHNLLSLQMLIDTPEGQKIYKICGLGIQDRLVLLPYHFCFLARKQVKPVLVTSIYGDVEEEIDFAKAVRIVDRGVAQDLAFIKLSMRHHAFKKIVDNFVSEKEVDKLDRTEAMLIRVGELRGARIAMEMSNFQCVADCMESIPYGEGDNSYVLLRNFTYKCNTIKGDCGSALLAINEHVRGKIFGIHVAGTKYGLGAATPVTKEMLLDHMCEFEEQGLCERVPLPILQDLDVEHIDKLACIRPGGNLKVVGIVKPEYGQRLPQKTDIKPSLLYGRITEPITEPSVLTPSDPRVDPNLREKGFSPMEVGLTKFETPCHPFPPRDLEMAKEVILSQLQRHTPYGMDRRLLTLEETINGVPSANFTRINMGTSPGMPYKNYRAPGQKGKQFLFDCEDFQNGEVYYSVNVDRQYKGLYPGKLLLENYLKNEERLKQGVVPEWYTYSNLKQERRKKAKIFAGETRLFECSPLDQTLLYRKYFGAFIACMNQNCTTLPSSVGINPEGPDWTELYRRLSRFNGMVLAGDYKGWDGILPGDVMEKALEVINEWYNDGAENARVRRGLIETAIHTFILCRDVMILKNQGIPSGIPLTADINGLCNWFYMLCCLFQLARENNYKINAEDIERMIEFAFYGDDHVVAPHPNIQSFFNFDNVKKFFEKQGITYTDAMKTGKDPNPLEPLQKVTYLKRMFVPNEDFPDKIMGPIDMGTIDEEINWIRESADDFEATFQNLSAAKLQLVQHGRQTFERKMKEFNRVIAEERAKDLKYAQSSRWTTFTVDYDNELKNWLDQFG